MTDIGKNLRELREQKGLTLKDISEITKINIRYLEFLEENNFSFLPEVYVRSFLKNYLKAINVDEREFIDALNEILHPIEYSIAELKEVKQTPEISKERKHFPIRFLIGKSNVFTPRNIVFFIIAVILLSTTFILLINRTSEHENLTSDIQENQKMYEESNKQISNEFHNIAMRDSLLLGISATDSVWIQVKIDDSKVEEVYMRRGDVKEFKGKTEFKLLVGNSGALILKLNGIELPFIGVKGSVKRLKIDKNGVQLIQVKNESQRQ